MNIDEYLDLQDQTETNLLLAEHSTSAQPEEQEMVWHSTTSTLTPDNNNNGSSNNNNNNNSNSSFGGWDLLQQNGFENLEGINFTDLMATASNGVDATSTAIVSNHNHFITPDSLMKQPPPQPLPPSSSLVIPALEPQVEQPQKRVTRSRSKPASSITPAPKKKKATRAKKLYCTCQQPYNGEPMVQCDTCEEWFHCSCVDFNLDNQEEEDNIDWVCNNCKQVANEPKIKIVVKEEKPIHTRQTRAKAQSKCLYSDCNNHTRKDSFCSDVCARKQNELEASTTTANATAAAAPNSRSTRRKLNMRTSTQSMTPSTLKDKRKNSVQDDNKNTQQEDTSDDSSTEKEEDGEEFQAKDKQEEEEDENKDEVSQSASPDTPRSPSQMTEEENPVRRNVIKNMKTVLKAIFDVALADNADMMDESTLTTEERAEALAKSIENTMLEQLGDGGVEKKRRTCGEPYKSKFRSLLYNLKDKANKVFQIRVVTGDLTPDELVKMSSEDMANPELKSMSEVFRKRGLKNSVMKIDNTPIIKKTHKGDIIMVPDKDNNNMYSEQVQQELDKIDKPKSPSLSSSPTSSITTTTTTTTTTQESNTNKKAISSLSPTTTAAGSTHPLDPLDDILARIGIPAQDDNSHVSNKRSMLSEVLSAQNVDPEVKKRRVTLDVEALLGDEDETFQVDEVDTTTDDDKRQEKEEQEEQQETEILPTVWRGRVNMPQVAEFEASARQIGGRLLSDTEWDQVLSPTMWIEGRIPSERVTNYVTQTQYSTSREIVLLEVEAKGGDANQQGQVLLNYLDSRQRYAVVGHNKTRIKDFYLIPLYKAQHIPDCLYVVRVEETKRQCDLFLGVLVLTKQAQKPIQPPVIPQAAIPYSAEILHQQQPMYQQQQQHHQQPQGYQSSTLSYQPPYGYNINNNTIPSTNPTTATPHSSNYNSKNNTTTTINNNNNNNNTNNQQRYGAYSSSYYRPSY